MSATLFRSHYRVDLTAKQRQVLDLVARGKTNFEIAQELGISLDGAKWHLRELFAKLDVGSREEAAEWWREYNAPRQRLGRVVRGLLPATIGKWLIAGGVSAVVVVGIAVAVIVALDNRGGGSEQAGATVSPTVGASATASSEQTAAATPATVLGVPVRDWSTGPASDLPAGVVVIMEHGCTQCDGPTSSLERIVGGTDLPDGTRTLFPPPGLGTGYIYGFDIAPGGEEIYVTWCSRGYCGGVAQTSDDAQTTIYHSTDGGVTWRAEESYAPPASVALGDGGWTVTQQHFDGATYSYTSFPYPDAETAPEPKRPTVPDSLKAALAGQFDEETGILPVSITPGGDTIVQWVEPRNGQRIVLIGRLHDGGLDSVMTLESPGVVSLGGWIADDVAIGNYSIPADPSLGAESVLTARPALLDFESATVTPLNIGDSNLTDPTHLDLDRDRIVSVQSGAFAMVDTGGDCLNVREEASTDSNSLGCFADGVLLSASDVISVVDGEEWLSVTTPSGHPGWANMAFLVR